MENLKLIVPTNKLCITSAKIHGTIYFENEAMSFPDNMWDDFVAVILSWWIQNLGKIRTRAKGDFVFYFMDGPVEIRGEYEDDICKLKFVRRYSDAEDILHEATITGDALMQSLIDVAQSVIHFAEEKKWETEDIASLRKVVQLYSNS